MKTLLATSVLGILLMVGCGGNSSSTPPAPPAAVGSFGFNAITKDGSPAPKAQLARGVAAAVATTTDTTTFDFGNLTSTATFLFELRNTGTVPVNNITVTTDNPNVEVATPSQIGVLPTEGTGSVIPLISVQVLHGVGVNGYGTAPTLAPGPLTFNLTATGTDANANTVTTTAAVTVHVQVASVELWIGTTDGTTTVAPFQVFYGVCPALGNAGTYDPKVTAGYANFDSLPPTGWWNATGMVNLTTAVDQTPTRTYTLKNTGNVDVVAHDFGHDNTTAPVLTTIPAGASVTMTLNDIQISTMGFSGQTYIYLDSSDVVFASSMPAAEPDGKFYFGFTYSEAMQ